MDLELQVLREIYRRYNEEDIYNLDKTRLHRKMIAKRSLATCVEPGLKPENGWVTVAVCGNADGSDKVGTAF